MDKFFLITLYLFHVTFADVLKIFKAKFLKDLHLCARHLLQNKPVVYKTKKVRQTYYCTMFWDLYIYMYKLSTSHHWINLNKGIYNLPWVLQNADPDLPPLASQTLHRLKERINLKWRERFQLWVITC